LLLQNGIMSNVLMIYYRIERSSYFLASHIGPAQMIYYRIESCSNVYFLSPASHSDDLL